MLFTTTMLVVAVAAAEPPAKLGLRTVDLPPASQQPQQPVGNCPGSGACDQPNGTPGCDDADCCNAVCLIVPTCCIIGWDANCVSIAETECGVQTCSGAQGCQVADNQTHGGGNANAFFGLSSDQPAGSRAADNFTPSSSGSITSVCWWGSYFDFNSGSDCSETAVDSFTITYYEDDQGLPGTEIASFAVTPSRVDAGAIGDGGTVSVHRFDATHAAVAVTGGECYWLQIRDTLDASCIFTWATAPPGDQYAVVDGDGAYDVGDTGNWDHAWCLDIAVGDLGPCEAPTPMEECRSSDVVLTQNTDPDTVQLNNGVACNHTDGGEPQWTLDNYYARSYNLALIAETAGQEVAVECVQLGVEVNHGGANLIIVNLYEDTNGGAPQHPNTDLSLLGSSTALAPGGTSLALITAEFDPPVDVPVDAILVVELNEPSRSPTVEGDSGILIMGSNSVGQTLPSMFRTPSGCMPDDNYRTLQSIGFGNMHVLQRVHLQVGGGTPCPWDCGNFNGEVDTADFLALLGQWGQVDADCDFDGGGVATSDFLSVLGNWGPCPP